MVLIFLVLLAFLWSYFLKIQKAFHSGPPSVGLYQKSFFQKKNEYLSL